MCPESCIICRIHIQKDNTIPSLHQSTDNFSYQVVNVVENLAAKELNFNSKQLVKQKEQNAFYSIPGLV